MNSNLKLNAHWQKQNGTWVHVDLPRQLSGKALLAYKKNLVLNSVQKKTLTGLLLGDGYLNFNPTAKNPGFYFVFAQGLKRADYVDHMYGHFKPFVGTPPKINLIGGIKPGKPARYEARFKTYRHDVFKPYYDLFYPLVDGKRTKRVPQNIGDLLTPRGLAYWYMDDGNLTAGNTPNLSSHSFEFSDAEVLKHVLLKIFNLSTYIVKDHHRPRLYVNAKSRLSFFAYVKPYIVPCLRYKLHSV